MHYTVNSGDSLHITVMYFLGRNGYWDPAIIYCITKNQYTSSCNWCLAMFLVDQQVTGCCLPELWCILFESGTLVVKMRLWGVLTLLCFARSGRAPWGRSLRNIVTTTWLSGIRNAIISYWLLFHFWATLVPFEGINFENWKQNK
jgi:hypothetical protein